MICQACGWIATQQNYPPWTVRVKSHQNAHAVLSAGDLQSFAPLALPFRPSQALRLLCDIAGGPNRGAQQHRRPDICCGRGLSQ